MSGLLLKDFYTIGHNAKQMMLILLIWACLLYTSPSPRDS